MRQLLVLTLCAGCAAETDGRQEDMDVVLEQAVELPESDEVTNEPQLSRDGVEEQFVKTMDCGSGGTVKVTIRRSMEDEPFVKKGYIAWRYEMCSQWPFGTIDGNASYSNEVQEGWRRSMRYFANLEYSGEEEGDCNAYVTLEQNWRTSEHVLKLPATCPHPVREWWERLGVM